MLLIAHNVQVYVAFHTFNAKKVTSTAHQIPHKGLCILIKFEISSMIAIISNNRDSIYMKLEPGGCI